MSAGAKLSVPGQDQSPRPKGTRAWAGYVLEEGQPAPPHQLRRLGERSKLPQRGPGQSSAAKRFTCILEAPHGLSWNLLGAKFGEGHGLLAPFLKSAYGFTDKYQLLQMDLRDARPHLHRAVLYTRSAIN